MLQQFSSVWITANAGSGKTTYLTKRVLSLLLMGVSPERICCITYTKAAASEMRHRVLKQLRYLLLSDDHTCGKTLQELLGRPATSEDMTRARSLFGMVLDSPTGGLQLTTVHGFCQSILRRFPLEAGINPHFTVLEEAAAERLITGEKNRLLKHYNGDHPALNQALELIASRASEARFDQFISAIIAKRSAWEQAWRGQSSESLRTKLLALHGLPENITQEQLSTQFASCIGPKAAQTIRSYLPQLQVHKNETERKLGRVMASWLEAQPENRHTLIAELCELFLTKEGAIRKSILNKKDFPEGSDFRDVLETTAQLACRYQEAVAALACVEESHAMALLAQALLDLYAQAKEAHHALDYDDLISKTQELFANPSMLGWVMSKLDHRIDHLLVDEAQDTSGEQWAITSLLVEELIATNDGIGSGNLPRSVLVVGDEKQSIYSFQGAAPELFSRTNSIFSRLLETSNAPLQNEELSKSYRSTQTVLEMVNHISRMPEMAEALSADNNVQPHVLVREGEAGSITLYPLVTAEEAVAVPPLTMPTEYTTESTASQKLAEEVAATIEQWIRSGRILENTGKPVQAGDILILVHKRAPLVLPLIRALERRDVPVAGIDRLTLSAHLAVRDLLSLMRWVLNPADDLALAQVLRSPLIGMDDLALRALCFNRTSSLWSALDDQPLLEQALYRKHQTPYDFLTHILETANTRILFAERFGEEVHEVLDELKSQSVSMPEGTAPTIANFHDWLSGNTRQIKREQESGTQDKVRIMTVHGAKGLEARVVLLVDTVRVPTTQKEMFYFTEDKHQQSLPALAISEEAKRATVLAHAKQYKSDALMAEYYRLLYVALTRAQDELHIWGTATGKGTVNAKSWYALAERALIALGTEGAEGTRIFTHPRQKPLGATTAAAAVPSEKTTPDWIRQTPLTEASVQKRFSPSQLAEAPAVSAYVEQAGQSTRARGVLIHRLLELISATTSRDALVRLSQLVAPAWEADEREHIVSEIMALVTTERWIWEHTSHAEVNIAGNIEVHGEAMPVSGQIDRIVVLPDEIVVIDYKTGRHVPHSAADISETYRLQMKAYRTLLQDIWPGRRIRPAILWTSAPKLMWCDEEVEQTAWPLKQAS